MYSNYGAPEYDTRASKRPKTESNMWDDSDSGVAYGGYDYTAQSSVSDSYIDPYSSFSTGAGRASHRPAMTQDNSSFGDWLSKSGSQDGMGEGAQGLYDNGSSTLTGYGGYGDAGDMDTSLYQQSGYPSSSGMMDLGGMSNTRVGRGSQMRSESSYDYGRSPQSQSPIRSSQMSTSGSYMASRSGSSKPKMNTSGGSMGSSSGGRFGRQGSDLAGRSAGLGSGSGGRGRMSSGSGGMRREENMGSRITTIGSMGSGQQRGFHSQMDRTSGSLAENDDDDDFMTNLTLRMAAEMQQKKHGKLDVKKILKVMEIVDKLTDGGSQDDVSQVEQFVSRSSSSGAGGFRGGGGGGGGASVGGAQQSNMNMMNTNMNMMMDGSNMMNRMGMMNQMQGMNFNPMQQQQQQQPRMGGMMGGGMMGEGMGFSGGGGGHMFNRNMSQGAMFSAGDRMPFARGRGGPGFRGRPSNRGRMQDMSPKSLMDMHLTGQPFGGQPRFRPEKRRHPGDQPPPRGFSPGGFNNPRQHNPSMGFPPRSFVPKNLSERLHRYCDILKQQPHISNPITKLEENLNLSGLNLTLDYKFEEVVRCGAKFVVTGRLMIGNVFVARAMGEKKKEVKFACYKKALRTLLNSSVNSIMSQKDKSTETIKKELLDEFELKKGTEDKDDKRHTGLKHYEEELKKLIDYLKSPPADEESDSDFARLAAAIKGSECGLVHNYTEVTTYVTPTVMMYTGRFTIAGTLLGTASASLRRNAKSQTYTTTMTFLKETDLKDIVKGFESKEDELTTAMFRELAERQTTLPNEKTESKLAQLINAVAKISKTTDLAMAVDKAVIDANLLLTLLSKRSKLEGSSSNALAASVLYIDNIYMATGEGVKQPEAKVKVYDGVLSVLSSTSADVLVSEGKKLSQDDLQKVMLVKEIWAKGECSTFYWSNFTKMKAGKKGLYFCNDTEDIPRTKDNMILVESHRYSIDRYKFAYDILLQSATMNMILLHGKTVWYANMHRCEIFLEGEKISEAIAKSRAGATMKAASKFLFVMYQERTTIKTALETESAFWHSYESIKEKADKLKLEKGDAESDDMIDVIEPAPKASQSETTNSTQDHDDAEAKEEAMETDGQAEGNSEEKTEGKTEGKTEEKDEEEAEQVPTLRVNKWVKDVMEGMICDFAKRETLEDLVFGVGFPAGERRQMFLTASENKLYCTNRKTSNQEVYTVLYHKYSIGKQLEILEINGGACGKFSILPKESLPSMGQMKELMQASLKASQQKRASNTSKKPDWQGRSKNRSNKRKRPEKKGNAPGGSK